MNNLSRVENSQAKNISLSAEQIDYLLSPAAIRERAQKIFELTKAGKTSFEFHEDRLQPTVKYVLDVIRKNYPDMKIPFHSRWGHFRAGGIDRAQFLDEKLRQLDPMERARTKLDLVITSVLLDAGAGGQWSYYEDSTAKSFGRSEGLGVASYYMFNSGVMSSDKKSLRADTEGLLSVTEADLRKYFQVSDKNPLVGVSGRVQLLNNLGRALNNKTIFKDGRPGNIIDYLVGKFGKVVDAPAVLRAVLDGLGVIWPGRLTSGDVNLGDVWIYSKSANAENQSEIFGSLIPIHKLSQWMSYSLIEPMLEAGLEIRAVEGLTGLAEYRNGGLMLDSGLLTLKQEQDAKKEWPSNSDLIIEWRALTIYLLDIIGSEVQKALQLSPQEFPLAKVLEGGTWWAGRFLAQEKRNGGVPPLNILSDGTVF